MPWPLGAWNAHGNGVTGTNGLFAEWQPLHLSMLLCNFGLHMEDTLLFTHLLMYDRETGIGEFSLEEPELLDSGLLESMEDASSCAFDCISANARLVHQHHQTY
jgi:hypothetical protein